MTCVRPLDPAHDLDALRGLWAEYLGWGNDQLALHYGLRLGEPETMVMADLAHLDKYAPPQGALLLAETAAGVMGSVAVRQSRPGIAEIKRLYVRPAARGLGLARELVAAAMRHARVAGYASVRLDSARFMAPAHALYRQHGFIDCDPYAESEVPAIHWPHWVFMQCPLTPTPL